MTVCTPHMLLLKKEKADADTERDALLTAVSKAHGYLVTTFRGAYTPEILGAIAILSDALLEGEHNG